MITLRKLVGNETRHKLTDTAHAERYSTLDNNKTCIKRHVLGNSSAPKLYLNIETMDQKLILALAW